jgi:eukaryotic-like serine/threonine-protein kinase
VLHGTRIGPYEIVAPLGMGGMGEVYRAADSRLKRQVAIKILPAALAADPDRLARFQREAEVLASLNHPHIAAVYGLEEVHGTESGHAGKALVMELVDGPTLADRIRQGPLPVHEAVAIARQIAAALEAAHEQGIIHRDLKPANIKVRDDGTVKVLDFGLAKLADAGARGTPSDLSNSPTITAAPTGMGIILGTAAYMSPEQARGRAVDKRTDVWAFGAVLYEMLTGHRAFDGEDVTEMMASVVKSTPDWSALPADTPPQVVTLIQRCLDKDRGARIGDIAVARFLLSEQSRSIPATPGASVPESRRRSTLPRWVRTAAAGTLCGVLTIVLVGWLQSDRPTVTAPLTRLQMSIAPAEQLPNSTSSLFRPAATAFALSPDGRQVVFAGRRGEVVQLYVRPLDAAIAKPLPGTEGAAGPFFSPDGVWIGFWAGKALKKVPASGGPPATITEIAGLAWGATWGDEGTIYYATDAGIYKISPEGGAPATVTTADGSKGERHVLPHVLPDEDDLLFTIVANDDWEKATITSVSLKGGDRRVLVTGGADARYVETGHLLYMKSGTLMAVAFDSDASKVAGTPVALVENVMHSMNTGNSDDETGAGQFAISKTGTLLYVEGGLASLGAGTLTWVDRTGAARAVAAAAPAGFLGARLSPDGQKIAAAIRRERSRATDVWVYDVARGAPTRVTFDGGAFPTWAPDSRHLVIGTLKLINADGTGNAEPLLPEGKMRFPASWASGANALVYLQETENGSNGIWALPMSGAREPRLFLESRFQLWHPHLSPDGRWMAYVSNESGLSELYVQPYPGPGEKIRISVAGGFDPLWSADGRELFYRSFKADRTQQYFSASIRSAVPFRIDPPRLMFETKPGEYDTTAPERSWDVTADGRRFLLTKAAQTSDRPVTLMQIVLNWADALKRLAPEN